MLLFIMTVGDLIIGILGFGFYALILFVVSIDLILGFRKRLFLIYGIFQVCGLIAGILWAYRMGANYDIAGPYAWSLVIGAWGIIAFLFHAACAVSGMFRDGKRQ